MTNWKSAKRFAGALSKGQSGNALIEFAFSLPLLTLLGGYGIEMANLAMVNQQVSQAAMALADNMSRVGASSALAVTQIREADVVDSFEGIKRQADGLKLTTYGRVILSSLQRNAADGQWIAWQRCIGMKNVSSLYGAQGDGATGTGLAGMGPATARITAPPDSAVMFVEIVYDYQPLFLSIPTYGAAITNNRVIRYEASFIVRDARELASNTSTPTVPGIINPGPTTAPVKTCSTYSAT